MSILIFVIVIYNKSDSCRLNIFKLWCLLLFVHTHEKLFYFSSTKKLIKTRLPSLFFQKSKESRLIVNNSPIYNTRRVLHPSSFVSAINYKLRVASYLKRNKIHHKAIVTNQIKLLSIYYSIILLIIHCTILIQILNATIDFDLFKSNYQFIFVG